jgi:hypothetical protein
MTIHEQILQNFSALELQKPTSVSLSESDIMTILLIINGQTVLHQHDC